MSKHLRSLSTKFFDPVIGTPLNNDDYLEKLQLSIKLPFFITNLVIIFGTMIGKILEKSGAAVKMADVVLKLLGDRHPAIAMSIIGWIVSIPVFCDCGYVILSSLKKSLTKKTGVSVVTPGR